MIGNMSVPKTDSIGSEDFMMALNFKNNTNNNLLGRFEIHSFLRVPEDVGVSSEFLQGL